VPTAFSNGYQPIAVNDFAGGLNLRDKADAVGDREAIDLLNVTFTERGAIRQRDGFTDLTPADLTNRVDSLAAYYNASGARHLIAGCGTRLEAIDNNGAVLAAMTGLTSGPYTFARFGAPGTEPIYAANGADTPRKWNGSAWSAPTATVNGVVGQALPRAGSIAVTPAAPGATSSSNANNRLVATGFATTTGGPAGAATNPSRAWYSNPNQPEIWETDGDLTAKRGRNFVDFTPGDGERIMAAVTWRELTFIFKETKFFVQWGESTGPDGYSPVFNYREVVNNIGLPAPLAVTTGRDGVYLVNRRGVYRTTGGDPELLSDIISPLWTGDPEVYYGGEPINIGRLDLVRMLWHMEQLFIAIPTGGRNYCDRLLLYDTQHRWWSIYDIAASALAGFRRVDRNEVTHGLATGSQRVARRNYGSASDRGAPIVSRWRSGWTDLGATQQKTIRETKVWGSGAVILSPSTDFARHQRADIPLRFTPIGASWDYGHLTARGGLYSSLASSYTTYANLAQNTTSVPVVDGVLARYATRGSVFSIQFANNPDASTWTVRRLVRHMREIRQPSVT
jgi:hypothetical protein